MKVLVLCDDIWHPAEVIKEGIRSWGDIGFSFDFMMNPETMLTRERMNRYRAIINCKGNNLNAANKTPWFSQQTTEAGPQELKSYIEEGGGFLSIHAGNSFSEQALATASEDHKLPCREYIGLIGNCFITHPPRCPVQIRVKDKKHPVMQGVSDFFIRDEHYELELVGGGHSVLFETVSETGGTQVGGYIKKCGQGRICTLTPGHVLSVWENESFKRLVINALCWCTFQT